MQDHQPHSLFGDVIRTVAPILICTLSAFLTSASPALAQKPRRSDRKVTLEVKPAYPATLKNLHIEGLVRLTVTVLPDGNVSGISVKGGNPILVENALKAVKSWKFAPASSQTEEELTLNFSDR